MHMRANKEDSQEQCVSDQKHRNAQSGPSGNDSRCKGCDSKSRRILHLSVVDSPPVYADHGGYAPAAE